MTRTSLLLLTILVLGVMEMSQGFVPVAKPGSPSRMTTMTTTTTTTTTATRTTSLSMGLFDGIMKAFENEKYTSPPEGVKATARHILVKTQDEATMLLTKINDEGASFATVATQYSKCPSKNQGGSLGSFRPGTMVPEFDEVVFNPDTQLNQVVGPVMTPFGYHLILVEKRTGM